ncbi:MAG: GHMP kinase [Elusimicrobia bacterium]|nr:GHMP kinase [Elusimicrobiota bacterium]
MIISRTPFRISFVGGGTDLEAFYGRRPGAVVSTAIDKFMYVTVNRYFDESILLKYSRTELVKRASDVRHPILRECLKLVGLNKGVEITSMSDVIGGTGLGSSSSFTVGVLHALHAFKGEYRTAEDLAREACEIEIKRLREPIGKQDQYIAAYGGFQSLEFMPDGTVRADPIVLGEDARRRLAERLLLVYTGVTRRAGPVLRRFRAKFEVKDRQMVRLRDLAYEAREALRAGDVDPLGAMLHEGWELKKSISGGISSPAIDRAYAAARRAGASGGKILGAGGGGFLLLFVPPSKRAAARRAVSSWREIPFALEPEGSKIVYVSR